ncbi:hypothetical protein C8J56DRAFT_881081 [Mycena floridula]|nr:hypothetical protein C8J56DRAFT_881081 [Mycena floridula]
MYEFSVQCQPFAGPKELRVNDLARHDAAYNSFEREREEASVCAPKTREEVLETLDKWAKGDGHPVCWLYGPAGAGKSTIAQTMAQRSDKHKWLAFSHFFSRRYSDRSNLSQFVPTFTFELIRRLPSLEAAVNGVLKKDARLFLQRLEDQLSSIATIVIPILSSAPPSHPLVIVIDGLDEYIPDEGKILLEQLIRVLIDILVGVLRFRILFTSRPEADIIDIFRLFPSTKCVPLQDFPAIHDVENYLRSQFDGIATRRKLGTGWPGSETIRHLAEKSEGIFAYASTLVRFVDAKYGDPRQNLKVAKHVLQDAKEYPNFELVISAVVLCRKQPVIMALPSLLCLNSIEDIRLALRGCLSILIVPDEPNQLIRPYHTSLQDFLTDPRRQQGQFFNLIPAHQQILDCSLDLITKGHEGPAREYAHQNWTYHLCGLLEEEKLIHDFGSRIVDLLNYLAQDHKKWMQNLTHLGDVKRLMEDLEPAIQRLKVNFLYLRLMSEEATYFDLL